jgi:hypothetical protein
MRIIITLSVVLLMIFSCNRSNTSPDTTEGFLPSDSTEKQSIQDSTASAESALLKQIFSSAWIEILSEGEGWVIDDPCDSAIPELIIENDTINLNWGDGRFNSYAILFSQRNQKEEQWEMTTLELQDSPYTKLDTVMLFVKSLDDNKTSWTIGSGLNTLQINFLIRDFKGDYPKRINDCSEFDKEYSQQENEL